MLPTLSKEQKEELEAVQAIFGDNVSSAPGGRAHLVTRFPIWEAEEPVEIGFTLPAGYPDSCGPQYELWSYPLAAGRCIKDIEEKISSSLKAVFVPGQEGLFECIDCVREILLEWGLEKRPLTLESNRQRELRPDHGDVLSPVHDKGDGGVTISADYESGRASFGPLKKCKKVGADLDNTREEIEIRSSSAPLVMRKSVFVAHVAKVNSKDQVDVVMESILKNKKVARATHNIMAYRIDNPETGMVIEDFDDDGESAAGGKLMQMLRSMRVVNVVVVVSRWYGGINLGPARFKCINTVAGELLRMCSDMNFQR